MWPVVGVFLMTTHANLKGGSFRVHKLNSSRGRIRHEKQGEKEPQKNTSLNFLLHFVPVPLHQQPKACSGSLAGLGRDWEAVPVTRDQSQEIKGVCGRVRGERVFAGITD